MSSDRAERNTQYTVAAIELVHEYVAEHRTWPSSWQDLEEYRSEAAGRGRPWMDSLESFKKHVLIDFMEATPSIYYQASNTSIRPTGPAYYGPIDARFAALLQLVEQCNGQSGASSVKKEERNAAGEQ